MVRVSIRARVKVCARLCRSSVSFSLTKFHACYWFRNSLPYLYHSLYLYQRLRYTLYVTLAGDHTDEQVAEIVAEHQRQLRDTLSRLDQSRAKQDKSIQQRLAERRQLKMMELHDQHSQEVTAYV